MARPPSGHYLGTLFEQLLEPYRGNLCLGTNTKIIQNYSPGEPHIIHLSFTQSFHKHEYDYESGRPRVPLKNREEDSPTDHTAGVSFWTPARRTKDIADFGCGEANTLVLPPVVSATLELCGCTGSDE